MKRLFHSTHEVIWALALTALGAAAGGAFADDQTHGDARLEFFEKKVRPILVNHCYQCHSADTKPSGGLRVDDRNGLLIGGDSGAALTAGDADHSLLIERVSLSSGKKKMPKEGDALTELEIADLKQWIEDGVAWPREKIPAYIGRHREDYDELKKRHWAWQPLTNPTVPSVSAESWARDDVDRFVLAGLTAKKLAPVGDADKATLLRRASFDLTGLPPKPEEIEAFQADQSPEAFARVVDRLLASPQYGEQWGRHWLDVARYGESTGPSRNIPYPHAWKYRDYVIDALNRDVPFDRFIQEQIAGDLLPAATDEEKNRLLTATGFLALGVKDVNQRFKVRFLMDNVDEQIDVVSRSVLGLTVSCARCHDHKFDPIPVTDYYALAGIFASTDDAAGVRNKMGGGGLDYYDPKMLVRLAGAAPSAPADQVAQLETEVAEAKKAWDAIRGTPEGLKIAADGKPTQRPFRLKYEKLQAQLSALTDPAERGLVAHGLREGAVINDTEVRIRGEAERLGPTVPRGFLTIFPVPDVPPVNPHQSGRLELTRWLTSPRNPLTARVIVNRIWAHLFGTGIVSTVDNFGVKGDSPSNPELLDYLAQDFIRDGWSVKKLVRKLVLTHAYQLGSDVSENAEGIDPTNRLIWRHSPRRLTAEEMRDAMLADAGRLDLGRLRSSAVSLLRMVEMRDNGPEASQVTEAADKSLHRSVYLPLLRGVIPRSLEAFDPVSQTLVSGERESTTVPTQALYLLNSSFVRQQALAWAEHVLADSQRFDTDWVREIYLRAFSRLPNVSETGRAAEFLGEYAALYREKGGTHELASISAGARVVSDESGAATAAPGQAANPDDVDRSPQIPKDGVVEPSNPKAAAWMTLIQSLYAAAEFRFVR